MGWYRAFYAEFNIFAILVVGMILVSSLTSWGQATKERIFRGALGCLITFLAVDMVWNIIDGTAFLAANHWALYLLKTIYFFSADCMAFFLYLYFKQGNEDESMEDLRTRIIHTLPPLAIHAVLLIINIPTGILFFIDEEGNYCRSGAFIVQYILIFSYLVAASVYLLQLSAKKEMQGDRKQILFDAAFPLIPLLAGTLQYFYPKLPINNIGFSCGTLYLFLSYTQRQVSVEPLTGLSNKRFFVKYLEQISKDTKAGMTNYLFMADINDFKAINDTYGHPEGDRALKFVSTGITNACQLLDCRYKAARYGGDEFIIVIEADDDFDVKAFIDSVQENISRVAKNRRFPADLTISIGHVVMGNDVAVSIQAADDVLYYYKRRYHNEKKEG